MTWTDEGQMSLFAESVETSHSTPTTSSTPTKTSSSTTQPGGRSSSRGNADRGSGTTAGRRGSKKSRKKTKQRPCVFSGSYIREEIDPRIKAEYSPQKAPFGDFRRQFKSQYCIRVNPTGQPGDCAYPEDDCANRFLQIALACRTADKPGALFRVMARSKGAEDADNRPLARDRVPQRRVGGVGPERGEDPPRSDVPAVPADEAAPPLVSDRKAPPSSLADLLGTLDLGTRQVQPRDGDEGMGS